MNINFRWGVMPLFVFFILLILILVSPVSAVLGYGQQTGGIAIVHTNNTINFYNGTLLASDLNVNRSNFWDNLNTPSDIPGSEYWYNHTSAIESLYGRWFYNQTTPAITAANAYTDSQVNKTFNQTLTDILYIPIAENTSIWAAINAIASYNQTFNQTLTDLLYAAHFWGYNQTTSAQDYLLGIISGNNSAWLSTFNSTYDAKISYNVTFNQSLTDSLYAPSSSANQSFNQTLTDSLYASSIWAYNQTAPFTTWLSTFLYNYNQTTPAQDYALVLIAGNNSAWLSTYNATYDLYAYNQTTAINNTFNQSLTDNLYSPIIWSYNQTTPAQDYALVLIAGNDSAWLSTYNSTYALWAYNQTNAALSNINFTFNQTLTDSLYANILWSYNQTTPAQDYLLGIIAGNNSAWLSTYNSTYDLWAYNQTQAATSLINNTFNQSLTDSLYSPIIWAYNQTSPFTDWLSTFLYNYNQTTPAQDYLLGIIAGNNSDWLSTYNATYALYAYNQTQAAASLINNTFNQSLTDNLYSPIIWAYNQTSPFTTWLSTFLYDYNQTTPAQDYALVLIAGNNSAWLSTYNSTYDLWAYNQTNAALANVNFTFNQTLTDSLYANILWSYNQTIPAQDYLLGIVAGNNSAWLSTYNATYALWAYNQTNAALANVNFTFNQTLTDILYANILWSYNQTTPAQDYLLGIIAGNNSVWLSTYNSTYDLYAYNQTTPAQDYILGIISGNNSVWLSTYNATYDLWAYNQTQAATSLINNTFNQSLTDTLYSNIVWNYNQTNPAQDYILGIISGNNSAWLSTYNSTYDLWAYNQTQAATNLINNTFNQSLTDSLYSSAIWGYNQTTPFTNWLSTFYYNYNQTTPAQDYALVLIAGNNSAWLSTFNATYALWSYNQTTAATSLINNTFNQSLTDSLYANILWSYNQTTPAQDYLLGIVAGNDSAWLSTYNTTYALWAYNQTQAALSNMNFTFNQTLTDILYANILWSYNQTTPAQDYLLGIIDGNNSAWLSTYNSTYALWAYNQTNAALANVNFTFNQSLTDILYASIEWNYNQTTPAQDYILGIIAGNESAWLSTKNETTEALIGQNVTIWNILNGWIANESAYSQFWYNQTTPAQDYVLGVIAGNNSAWLSTYNATYDLWAYNQTYSGSTFNATYDLWAYNQTTPAQDYALTIIAGNDSAWRSTYNSTYDLWAYNQTSAATSLINNTFNQTLTDALYSNIIWGYNMTSPFTNWLSTFYFDYNQTTPAQDYALVLIAGNNSAWLSTYNATYALWAYNQTSAALSAINTTFNQSLTDTLYANIIYDYNQTTPAQNYALTLIDGNNSAWLSTYNATYALWAYNQTTPAIAEINKTFNQSLTDGLYASIVWGYNMTTPFTTWLSTFLYDYNQTTPAQDYALALIDGNSSAWLSTANETTEALIGQNSSVWENLNGWIANESAYSIYWYNMTVAETELNFNGNWSLIQGTFNNDSYLTTFNQSYDNLIGQNSSVWEILNGWVANESAYSVYWYNQTSPAIAEINRTFNQSLTDGLYAGIEFSYNQTTPAQNYALTLIDGNNSAWLSTYNSTYDLYAYNQTQAATSLINNTFNQSLTDILYLSLNALGDILSNGYYNQTELGTIFSEYYNKTEFETVFGDILSNGYYNKTEADLRFAPIGGGGGNSTFNQTLTDNLYATLGNCSAGYVVQNITKVTHSSGGGGGSGGLLTGLKLYYKLDESTGTNADDAVGTSNGTWQSSPTWEAGKINNGATTGGYINLDSGYANALTGNWSLGLWFKSTAGGEQFIITPNNYNADFPYGFGLSIKSDGYLQWVSNNGGSGITSTTGGYNDNNWHYVLITHAATTEDVVIYVDGVSDGNGTGTIVDASLYSLTFAGFAGGGYGAYEGSLDEIGFWDGRVLSSTEASALYNLGNGLPYSSFGSGTTDSFVNDAGTAANGVIEGVIIHTKSAVTLTEVATQDVDESTGIKITDTSWNELASAEVISHKAIFNLTLSADTDYIISGNASGSWTKAEKVFTGNYPVVGTSVNFTAGNDGDSYNPNSDYAWIVKNITTISIGSTWESVDWQCVPVFTNFDNLLRLTANTTTVPCDVTTEGAIYYDGGDYHHYACDGTNWNALY